MKISNLNIKRFKIVQILLILSLYCFAKKDSVNNSYSIKVYNCTYRDYQIYSDDAGLYISGYIGKFISPSLAFNLQTKKGNFHEVEISGISYREEVKYYQLFDYYTRTSSFSGRYEYSVNLLKNKNEHFSFFMGIGSKYTLNAHGWKYDFLKTSSFNKNNQYVVDLNLIPRLLYYPGKRLYFDLNIPVVLYKYAILKQVKDDAKEFQKGGLYFQNLGAFSSLVIRLGLGYYLNR